MRAPGCLNPYQRQHLLSSCKHIDELLGEIEQTLIGADGNAAFPKFRRDLSPSQIRAARDFLSQIRSVLLRTVRNQGITPPGPQFGALHSIRVTLQFALISVEECRPHKLLGYGVVPPEILPQLESVLEELRSSVERLDRFLKGGDAEDLQVRAEKQAALRPEFRVVAEIERIIREYGLIEFRSSLGLLLDRIEDDTFEIAVFGRVSSGKSSLLNALIGMPVLPVGVNPITSVPTRIVGGTPAALRVWRASRPPEDLDIGLLRDFVTEERNPGNVKQVTRIRVTVPSERLPSGIVLVDTPGVGSVATAGALETIAYLPRCDYAVVLIDSASTLSDDEIALIRTLNEFGVAWSLLLSKADLLEKEDCERARVYTADRLQSEFGINHPIHAVSVRPQEHDLLNVWIDQEIALLHRERKQMRFDAVLRRIRTLRETVQATLEIRTPLGIRKLAPSPETLSEAEGSIRMAAAEADRVRNDCFEVARAIRRLRENVIPVLASHALANGRDGTQKAAPDWIATALQAYVNDAASKVASALRELSRTLAMAVSSAASAAALPTEDVAADIADAIREMPVFDPGNIPFEWEPSVLRTILPAFERRRLESKLEVRIGPLIEPVCSSYGALLEHWIRRTVYELQRRFDSYADSIRAQVRFATAEESTTIEIAGDKLAADIQLLSTR